MFANFKSRLVSVIAPDMPSTHLKNYQKQRESLLKDKIPYARPTFLQLLTADELKASADHSVRPIIVPRDIGLLPWGTGYAECVNSGKSEWNEDQAAFCRQVLADPTHKYPDLPYTYFGIFDGHAGVGAALSASHQFHHVLHEKLVDCLELILPREEDLSTPKSQEVNSCTYPRNFQRPVSKDELIIGALESAFMDMDSLIEHDDRTRYTYAGGCTACVSLFIHGKMFVANAGDSRAVLCQKKVMNRQEDTNSFNCDGSEGSFAEPFSFDHTPETERRRILGLGRENMSFMATDFTCTEFAKRPHESELGQRILCRLGSNEGWTFKTLTHADLKPPLISGEGKRSRLMGTLGVTRGFGDHELISIGPKALLKPFLTAHPDVIYRDLTKIVTIPDEYNEDGDYGILVMATDGLWDVSKNDAVARTVFQTLHKHPTEKHRYTMAAQELVAKARGKVNDYGHWRLGDSKSAATVDDISVIVIPVYQYYKEHVEYEQKCIKEYRERLERESTAQALEAKEIEEPQQEQKYSQEMAHVVVEPEAEDKEEDKAKTKQENKEADCEKSLEGEQPEEVASLEVEAVKDPKEEEREESSPEK